MHRLRLWLCAALLVGFLVAPSPATYADEVPVGGSAYVFNTNGQGLRLRAEPNTKGKVITTIPEASEVAVLDGPANDTSGQPWYQISFSGQTGYAAAAYLTTELSKIQTQTKGAALAAPVSSAPAGLAASPLTAPQAVATPAPALTTALVAPADTTKPADPAKPPAPPTTVAATAPVVTTTAARSQPPPVRPPTNGRITGASITQLALSLVGTPYAWGGKSPSGFDCAGFVVYVYGQWGITLPPTTYEQWNLGRQISQSELLIGDLVFFANTYGPGITHVGIYVGDNAFVHAESESVGVVRSSLVAGYWSTKYYGARRIVE